VNREIGSTRCASLTRSGPQLEKLAAAEPTDRVLARRTVWANRLEAQLDVSAGRPGAPTAAGRALELGEKLVHDGQAANADVGECAFAAVWLVILPPKPATPLRPATLGACRGVARPAVARHARLALARSGRAGSDPAGPHGVGTVYCRATQSVGLYSD